MVKYQYAIQTKMYIVPKLKLYKATVNTAASKHLEK
jgi:hypothetical protein